jgi:hypothetical protein
MGTNINYSLIYKIVNVATPARARSNASPTVLGSIIIISRHGIPLPLQKKSSKWFVRVCCEAVRDSAGGLATTTCGRFARVAR